MKKLGLLLLMGCFLSCQTNDPQEQLRYIEGYWEIDRVENPRGISKQYNFNGTVDFFDFENNQGTRLKAKPQIDGSFIMANSGEKVTAKVEEDSLRLYYETPFDKWKETVLKADEEELVIRGRSDIIYHYNKFKGYLDEEVE